MGRANFWTLCVCCRGHCRKLRQGSCVLVVFPFGGFLACQVADVVLTGQAPNGFNLPDVKLVKTVLVAPSIEKNDPTGLVLDPKVTTVIYGNKDEFVKPSSMYDFSTKFELSYQVVPNATHFFHGQLGELKQTLQNID